MKSRRTQAPHMQVRNPMAFRDVWPAVLHSRLHAPTLGIALVAFALVACAAPRGGPLVDDESPGRPSLEAAPTDDPGTDGVPEELLSEILDDAADRADMAAGELEVETAEAVTWNDGSLGCPEPGAAYTQALVPGYHVVVRAGDATLDYRATLAGAFRICDSPLGGGGSD